jgi:hypothetical protein
VIARWACNSRKIWPSRQRSARTWAAWKFLPSPHGSQLLSLEPPAECRVGRFRALASASGFGRVFPAADGSAACPQVPGPGSGFRGGRWGPSGVRTGSGWSGRGGGRPAGRVPQVQPFLLAVPAVGRWRVRCPRPWRAVRPAMAMRSRRMVAARGLRVGEAGEGSGRADKVLGHGRDNQPRGVRVEMT